MTRLRIEPMIWHLMWLSPDGEKPVEVIFAITAVNDDGDWIGEIRIVGYPASTPIFPLEGCDWVQAIQHFGVWGPTFLSQQFRGTKLTWRGTDIQFEYPQWRRRTGLLARLRNWYHARLRMKEDDRAFRQPHR
jgi:hypothetical protein